MPVIRHASVVIRTSIPIVIRLIVAIRGVIARFVVTYIRICIWLRIIGPYRTIADNDDGL